jgi:hypothetical protein
MAQPVTNITLGNSAEFIAQFFDPATGLPVIPASATLTVTYPTSAGGTGSSIIGMVLSGAVYTATWGSSVATLGSASWSANAPGQTLATTGALRLIG